MVTTRTAEISEVTHQQRMAAFVRAYLPPKLAANHEPTLRYAWSNLCGSEVLQCYGDQLQEACSNYPVLLPWHHLCLMYEFCRLAELNEIYTTPGLLDLIEDFIAQPEQRMILLHENPGLIFHTDWLDVLSQTAHYIQRRLLFSQVNLSHAHIERADFDSLCECTHLALRTLRARTLPTSEEVT